MIAYDLQCDNGHRFEGWFEDAGAYEKQRRQGHLNCPVCNSEEVVRVPSTFAIKGIKGGAARPAKAHSAAEAAVVAQAVMEYVERQFDNVGPDFTSEALKIHYGVSEPRNIRGTSTAREEETLRQEGVEFFKVPLPHPTPDKPDPPESDN
ncbi:MAG: DUF1178 family protein [Desulfatitalea sp.]|nr:DUF1178 family protein [Desulfatitalea sp.]